MIRLLKQAPYFLWGSLEYNFISKFKPLAPKEMIINLTYLCNSKCIMCNIWKNDGKGEMTVEEWQKALKGPIFRMVCLI